MADHYLQFSTYLCFANEVQKDWLTRRIEHLKEVNVEEYGGLGFEYEFEEGRLWIYANINGVPEAVELLVAPFMRIFHIDGTFTLTWANTCSKPRTDEFSGGAFAITAKKIAWVGDARYLAHRLANGLSYKEAVTVLENRVVA
jgi:hypothetical protein